MMRWMRKRDICDAEMWSRTQPAITTQLKGLVHEKVTVLAPNPDLHSGHYGAVAANPIRILSNILSGLHDADGKISIDGFYDNVETLPEETRRQWAELSRDRFAVGEVELQGGVVEAGYSLLEAMWGRPTIDMNGVNSGNQGPGERSVLPASATGRLSFRLVPGQSPEEVRGKFVHTSRQGCQSDVRSNSKETEEAAPFVYLRIADSSRPHPADSKENGPHLQSCGVLVAQFHSLDCSATPSILTVL